MALEATDDEILAAVLADNKIGQGELAFIRPEELDLAAVPAGRQLAFRAMVRRLASVPAAGPTMEQMAGAFSQALERRESDVAPDGAPRKKMFFIGGSPASTNLEKFLCGQGGYGNIPPQDRTWMWDPVLWPLLTLRDTAAGMKREVLAEVRASSTSVPAVALDGWLANLDALLSCAPIPGGRTVEYWKVLAPYVRLGRLQMLGYYRRLSRDVRFGEVGDFLPPYLREAQLEVRKAEKTGGKNFALAPKACYRCHQSGHFARDCTADSAPKLAKKPRFEVNDAKTRAR